MTEPRAVEYDHPVVLRRQVDQAARFEILDHAAVSVKQNQRPTLSALHVMQTHPVDLNEVPLWRIVALRFLGKLPVHDGRCREKTGSRCDCCYHRVMSGNRNAAR
jgi:hypothetical protein